MHNPSPTTPAPNDPAISLAHTHALDDAGLTAIRQLLDDAFEGEFSDADWDHALGGVHVLARHGDDLMGHAAVVQRHLLYTPATGERRVLRAGFLEAMAVRADRQRRGIGAAIMGAVNGIVRGAYALGALSSSEAGRGLYLAQGWQPWQGRTFAMTPEGVVRTEEEDDGVLVLPANGIELTGDLACDWREGDLW